MSIIHAARFNPRKSTTTNFSIVMDDDAFNWRAEISMLNLNEKISMFIDCSLVYSFFVFFRVYV